MRNYFVLRKNVPSKDLPYQWLFRSSSRHFSTKTTGIIKPQVPLIPQKDINIRTMTKEDLTLVAQWAKEEGWNPGKYEVEPLYAADPRGYRILEVDGEPVASLGSVRHSNDYAFLGLYMVKREFRGYGYGKLLWDVAMGTLQDCRTIALNGVLNQTDNYQQSGFVPATLNTRWRGVPTKQQIDTDDLPTNISLQKDVSLTSLIDYDAKIFSTPRPTFISKWLTMPESHVLAAVDKGVLRGYGAISVSAEGYKIAPLYADDQAIAEKLFAALSKCIGNKNYIHLDTNESNPFSSALAKRFGLEKTFDTLRMYKGPIPQSDDVKAYGSYTLEIG